MDNQHTALEKLGGLILIESILFLIIWIFSSIFGGILANIIVFVLLATALLLALYLGAGIFKQVSEEKKLPPEQREQLKNERLALKKEDERERAHVILTQEKEKRESANKIVCSNCKSTNIEFMGNNKKNFSVGKAVAGTALTGGVGALAGFAGKKGNDQWFCKNCNQVFETKK